MCVCVCGGGGTVRKSDFFPRSCFLQKEKVHQAKRQMRATLKEYPYIFQKYFLNSQLEKQIQDPGIPPFSRCSLSPSHGTLRYDFGVLLWVTESIDINFCDYRVRNYQF